MTRSSGEVNGQALAVRDQVLQQIEVYERKARLAIAECQDLSVIRKLDDDVDTLRIYGKKVGVDTRNINRLTILSGDTRRALGRLTKAIPQDASMGRGVSNSKLLTLADANISKMRAARCEQLEAIPDERWEEIRAQADDEDREWSLKDLYRIGRGEDLEKEKASWQADDEFKGSISLVHQDAISYLATIESASIDLLLTDPPYSTDIPDIRAFARSWLSLALSRVKPTGRAYVFIGAYPQEIHAYLDAYYKSRPTDERHYMNLEMILPWTYRNTIGPSPGETYSLNWQACLYFVGPEAPALNTDSLTEKFSVQDINAPDGRFGIRLHPWQKPDEIAERFIRHATEPGQMVLDPFAGTGTFLAAAARLGRNAIGCEIDEEMLAFCKQRGLLP